MIKNCPVCGKPNYESEAGLGWPITFLPCSERIHRTLISGRVYTVKAISEMSDYEMSKLRGIGKKSMVSIKKALEIFNECQR